MDFKLRLPFNGNYGITFGFGSIPDSEELKKKYNDWGLVGHNGLDYGLGVGTEVLASASGKVIQSGDNGDYGISVTLQHDFGQTIYGHLSETKVNVGDEPKVGDLIGLSGESGNVTGPHLHFGIKLNNADENNGYLGYSDPSPYFSTEIKVEEKQPEEKTPEPEVKVEEQPQPTEQPKVEEPKPEEKKEEVKPPEEIPQPEIKEIIKEVPVEVIKEVIKEVPVVDQAEVNKQVEQKLKEKLLENKKKADEKRAENKKENLNKILDFVKDKKEINNQDIRDLLQVSQSTASYYLTELVSKGLLKTEKKGKATVYSS